MCLEGNCKIHVRSTDDIIELKAGYSTLIPAEIADYDVFPLTGKSKILDTFIDNQNMIGHKITRFLHIGVVK